MDNIFRTSQQTNYFDNLAISVRKIYEDHPLGGKLNHQVENGRPSTRRILESVYRWPIIPLVYRRFLCKMMRQINFDLHWFDDFSSYWSRILGGRPLWGVHDFYFLMNLYRVRFQNSQIPDTGDASIHLQSWQQPELLYQLFHLVYKESMRDHSELLRLMFRYKKKIRSFLEYGCGTAPVTTAFFDFYYSSRRVNVYIADIQTIAFHYGAYKFRRRTNVTPVLLLSEDNFQIRLKGQVDAIFCITVFEHLNSPLETAQTFHRSLPLGGLLFFDYIKSDGEGMDTLQGTSERDRVLDFVEDNFEILYGRISKEQSMGLTIAKKKNEASSYVTAESLDGDNSCKQSNPIRLKFGINPI